jgi:hypothetical protein
MQEALGEREQEREKRRERSGRIITHVFGDPLKELAGFFFFKYLFNFFALNI